MALLAASCERFGPLPIPNPIREMPESFKVFLTSAKSKFTNPDTAIKSEID